MYKWHVRATLNYAYFLSVDTGHTYAHGHTLLSYFDFCDKNNILWSVAVKVLSFFSSYSGFYADIG